MLTEEEMQRKLRLAQKERRYFHTLGVVKEAVRLAPKFGVDTEKAKIAALLHDCAKNFDQDRFLDIAAQSDGEIINYTNIAQDCGVSSVTVREYFNILEQTLIGYIIPAFTLSKKRKALQSPKFYYFDIGIVNHLLHRRKLLPGSVDFGHAFEHLMIQEIIAYLSYTESYEQLSYWRTSNGYEVDAIIGEGRIAIELKSSEEIQSRHTKGLKAFEEEFPNARKIIVSLDKNRRTLNGIEIIPATEFLKMMWNNEII